MPKVTFDELVKLEPKLGSLLEEAKAMKRASPPFCANAVWYGYRGYPGIKPRLIRLVGWNSKNPDSLLHGERAYDVAYQTIYHALPDCRHEDGC